MQQEILWLQQQILERHSGILKLEQIRLHYPLEAPILYKEIKKKEKEKKILESILNKLTKGDSSDVDLSQQT